MLNELRLETDRVGLMGPRVGFRVGSASERIVMLQWFVAGCGGCGGFLGYWLLRARDSLIQITRHNPTLPDPLGAARIASAEAWS